MKLQLMHGLSDTASLRCSTPTRLKNSALGKYSDGDFWNPRPLTGDQIKVRNRLNQYSDGGLDPKPRTGEHTNELLGLGESTRETVRDLKSSTATEKLDAD
jgi:hypothetical protein